MAAPDRIPIIAYMAEAQRTLAAGHYNIGWERWQTMKAMGYPLVQSIEREGIRLTPEAVGAPHAGMLSPAGAAHLP